MSDRRKGIGARLLSHSYSGLLFIGGWKFMNPHSVYSNTAHKMTIVPSCLPGVYHSTKILTPLYSACIPRSHGIPRINTSPSYTLPYLVHSLSEPEVSSSEEEYSTTG
jgi:hypothetical protein